MSGYIKLHRSVFDWEWFDDIVVYKLFTGMLLLANWKEGRFRGEVIPCGSFVSSVRKLGETLKLSKGQVERGLNKLKAGQEITTEARHKYTIYTIVNYSVYQESQDAPRDSEQDATRDVSRDTSGTLTETQAEDNRRSKEDKKERKEEKSMSHPFGSELVTRWNTLAAEQPNLACVKTISKSRAGKISTRVKEGLTMEQFVKVLEEIVVSDFLLGKAGGWKVSFDWLIDNDRNWLKVYEGTYRNTAEKTTPFSGRQFETAQERRQREIKEQEERLLRKFGRAADDTTADKTTDADARFVEATELF